MAERASESAATLCEQLRADFRQCETLQYAQAVEEAADLIERQSALIKELVQALKESASIANDEQWHPTGLYLTAFSIIEKRARVAIAKAERWAS